MSPHVQAGGLAVLLNRLSASSTLLTPAGCKQCSVQAYIMETCRLQVRACSRIWPETWAEGQPWRQPLLTPFAYLSKAERSQGKCRSQDICIELLHAAKNRDSPLLAVCNGPSCLPLPLL